MAGPPDEATLRKWRGSDPGRRLWPCRRRGDAQDPCSWEEAESCPRHEPVQRAAVKYGGVVFSVARPFRHDAAIRLAFHELGEKAFNNARPTAEQGFVVSDGRFVSREEALVIARRSGQLPGSLLGGILTSEDLW